MKLHEIEEYREQLRADAAVALPWEQLRGKTILISGASGLIGSYLVDLLLYKNRHEGLNCSVVGICRDRKRAEARFGDQLRNDSFALLCADINEGLSTGTDQIDYVVHLASTTHPRAYSTRPIETIMTNLIGTRNLLDFACSHSARRFLFASSNEIYGENRGDTELFDEDYLGYIDCNTLRAGYCESKRCGEALCQAYIKEKGMDIVIPRFTRSYGPTILEDDSKAISQFIKNAVNGEDIVLKSKGQQYYSYSYVSDTVTGLLTVLLKGACGQAYNVADAKSDITLYDLASKLAAFAGTKVVTQTPEEVERLGYSKATKARLNGAKLQRLGWQSRVKMEDGLMRTIRILRKLKEDREPPCRIDPDMPAEALVKGAPLREL